MKHTHYILNLVQDGWSLLCSDLEMSVYLYLSFSVQQSICLSVWLSVCSIFTPVRSQWLLFLQILKYLSICPFFICTNLYFVVCLFVYLFLFLPWYGIGDLCFVHILKCNDLDCPCSNQIRILSQLERWRIESIRPEASCRMELILNLLGDRPGIRPLLHKQGRAENMEN